MKSTEIRVIAAAIAACFALLGSGIAHAKASKEETTERKSNDSKADDKGDKKDTETFEQKSAPKPDGSKKDEEKGDESSAEQLFDPKVEHEHDDGGERCSPVPEPANYALILAGLGVVGFVARRRKAD